MEDETTGFVDYKEMEKSHGVVERRCRTVVSTAPVPEMGNGAPRSARRRGTCNTKFRL